MFVACSTQCFGKHSLERALKVISELEFTKVDVAIHERGPHLKPSAVAADPGRYAQKIRIGSSLCPVAFSVEIAAQGEDFLQQFRAISRLARLSAVPVISIPAATAGSGRFSVADRPPTGNGRIVPATSWVRPTQSRSRTSPIVPPRSTHLVSVRRW